MDKLIKSACMAVLCVMSNYPEQKIPVMGFRSVLRFYELKHVESIVAKIAWFKPYAGLCDDVMQRRSVNAYNFIQIPASKETLDLLFHLAALSTDDVVSIRRFLCTYTYQLEELVRAVCILAYHYERGYILERFGVMLNRDYRGVITWQPSQLLTYFGWATIELINDQLTIIPHNSQFVTVIDCSGNSGTVQSYSK